MTEKVLSQEETKQIEDAAMKAAMNDTDVNAPSAHAVETAANQEQEKTQDEIEPRVEVATGLTQEELNQLRQQAALVPKLQKALDTTNGTYGGKIAALEKMITGLKSQPEKAEGLTPRKISVEDFKNLASDFPELAEKLAQDLSGVIGREDSAGVSESVEKIRAEFEEKLAERDREAIERSAKRLKKLHPDYQDIAKYELTDDGLAKFKDPVFGQWLSQQSDDVRDVVFHSRDADDVSDVLSAYKQTLKPAQQEKKTSALERAILPKGVNTSRNLSDKDREEAAMRDAMRD